MSKTKKEEFNQYEKIIEIQKSICGLKKDAKNPFHKSTYMSLTAIVNALKPILHEKGCYSSHELGLDDSGKASLATKIIYKDGTVLLQCKSPLPVKDVNDPQKYGSAITYMRRYNLTALLEIEEDDDDGQKATEKVKPKGEFDDWGKTPKGKKWCDEAFEKVKIEVKSCSMEDELKTAWKENQVDIARLKRYAQDLYAELISLKDIMKESF